MTDMKRVMLIGESGSGKSALIRSLSGEDFASRRSMSVEYHGRFINTPGAFLENRRFHRALISASADCRIMLFVQDARRAGCLFPPGFAAAFNRKAVGVVSHAEAEDARPERAERFLRNAGVADIVRVDLAAGVGLEALRELLS